MLKLDFQLNTDSLFCVLTVKPPSIILRSMSQENALKETKIRRLPPFKTVDSNNSVTRIECNSTRYPIEKENKTKSS